MAPVCSHTDAWRGQSINQWTQIGCQSKTQAPNSEASKWPELHREQPTFIWTHCKSDTDIKRERETRARAHTLERTGRCSFKSTCSRGFLRSDRFVRERKQHLLPPWAWSDEEPLSLSLSLSLSSSTMTAQTQHSCSCRGWMDYLHTHLLLDSFFFFFFFFFAQSLLSLVPSDLWESPLALCLRSPTPWTLTAGHAERTDLRPAFDFRVASPLAGWDCFFFFLQQFVVRGEVMVPVPHRLLTAPWELFFQTPPLFVFRCLSEGSCFFGKLTTVSLFNYVHFCCLLLHAVSGPLCVADLLRNMARKYLTTGVFRSSFTRVDGLVTGDLPILDAQVW